MLRLRTTHPWPTQCAVCRDWGDARICATCCARFALPVPRCTRCALRVPQGAALCGDCLHGPPPFDHAVAAVDYAFPWDRLLGALKFRDGLDLAPVMAGLLEQALRRAALPPVALIVPVPLSPARLRERGYNQAWELARRLGPALQIAAAPDLLVRRLHAPQQAGLPREQRAANVQGAFAVPTHLAPRLQGRGVALLDDVMTTGATAAEASRVLQAAGAASVQAWMVARTPRPDDV